MINKTPNLSTPDSIDELRYEHIKALIGKGVKPQIRGEAEFCEALLIFLSAEKHR